MSSAYDDAIDPENPPFRRQLEGLINRCSKENGSDTPDRILADYLSDCLRAFDKAVRQREEWYGRGPEKAAVEEPATA